MSELLEVNHVSYAYHSIDGETETLADISFHIKEGEFVSLLGPSGCGKTTLIKAILAQEEFEGEINISSSRKIGYISQDVIFLIQRSYRYQWSKLKKVKF